VSAVTASSIDRLTTAQPPRPCPALEGLQPCSKQQWSCLGTDGEPWSTLGHYIRQNREQREETAEKEDEGERKGERGREERRKRVREKEKERCGA
jgi:hypothetical protein